MAELNTRTCVSGYVLGSLIFHHLNNNSDVEGFILGESKAEEKNSITDSQMDHVQFEHTIDIQKHIPCSKLNSFYDSVGELKKEEIKNILSSHKEKNVIGWYRQRRNTEHRMTFREQLIHRNLKKMLSNYELVFMLLTSTEATTKRSTHRLEYSVYKPHGSQFHKIPVLVTNLGIFDQQDYCRFSVSCSSAGYNRAIKKHRVKFFSSDGSLKEVNEVNELNSSLQLELEKACVRVEESERSVEKLQTEVSKLRSILEEKRKRSAESLEQKPLLKDEPQENMLLCQATKTLFPDSAVLRTQALTLQGLPVTAYCCSTDHGIDIAAKLPVLLEDTGAQTKRAGPGKRSKANALIQEPPTRKRPFREFSRLTRAKKGGCPERRCDRALSLSGSETEDDLVDSQNGNMDFSHSPTF